MNITKTELPTRPFTVKKFKLEVDEEEYIVIEKQYECLISGFDNNNQEQILLVLFTDNTTPDFGELIKKWKAKYEFVSWDYVTTFPYLNLPYYKE